MTASWAGGSAHEEPARAKSDAQNALKLDLLPALLDQLVQIHQVRTSSASIQRKIRYNMLHQSATKVNKNRVCDSKAMRFTQTTVRSREIILVPVCRGGACFSGSLCQRQMEQVRAPCRQKEAATC